MSQTEIILGDCMDVLPTLPEKSVHCVVTSPPYWGLRCYGIEGRVWVLESYDPTPYAGSMSTTHVWLPDGTCTHCPGWRGVLGSEPTPDLFVEHIVQVFREVRRVLRDDGTCWLNLGEKMKSKNLVGIPWRCALALQADGWYLRSDIIWAKPNPMPESCTDRPTKSHEYLFLLSKHPRYYYDGYAVREAHKFPDKTGTPRNEPLRGKDVARISCPMRILNPAGRNKRTVWSIPHTLEELWPIFLDCFAHAHADNAKQDVWKLATQAYKDAHFATYPEALCVPPIEAGTSDKGCCPECGAPWRRVVETDRKPTRPGRDNVKDETGMANRDNGRHVTDVRTLGWKVSCRCRGVCTCEGIDWTGRPYGHNAGCYYNEVFAPVPCTVLDPFAGSGTTGVVAKQLGRKFIGIEANAEYAEMARKRIAEPHPESVPVDVEGQEMMFQEAGHDTQVPKSSANGEPAT